MICSGSESRLFDPLLVLPHVRFSPSLRLQNGMSQQSSIPFSLRFSYGAPVVPVTMATLIVYLYLPNFYADTLGMSVETVGLFLLITQIWDAVLDPYVGFKSDDLLESGVSRMRWMRLSYPLLGLSVVLLCTPSLIQGAIPLQAFVLAGFFFFYLFLTTYGVPYEALGIELTENYDERTQLLGFREGLALAATVLLGGTAAAMEVTDFSVEARYALMGLSIALLLVLGTLWCRFGVKRYEGKIKRKKLRSGSKNFVEAALSALSYNHFRVLLWAFVFSTAAAGVAAALIIFFIKDVLGGSAPSVFITIYFLAAVLVLPFWLWLAGKWEKHRVWIAGLLVNTASFFFVFFLGEGDLVWYGALVFLSGAGLGANLAMPPAIQADVVAWAEHQSKEAQEGRFVGIWSLSRKAAAAGAASAALGVLGLLGYEAGRADQDPFGLYALQTTYALVPVILNLIAIAILTRFSLTKEKVEEIS